MEAVSVLLLSSVLFTLSPLSGASAPCNNSVVVVTPDFVNITSPNYPGQFPNNLDCGWIFRARDPGNMVIVGIADMSIVRSTNCSTARLTVYDGANRTAPVINIYCGHSKDSIASTGDSLFVRFQTGTAGHGHGFRLVVTEMPSLILRWNADESSCGLLSFGGLVSFTEENALEILLLRRLRKRCSRHFTLSNISAESNKTIIIKVVDSQIQPSAGCTADYVSVYNGNDTTASNLLGAFCNDNTPIYQTGLNKALIVFETDNFFVMKGFKLTYKSVPSSSCSVILQADETPPNYIVSPGYPNAYYNNLDCVWTIISLQNKIELDVVSSDVEGPYPACGHDVVTVYSGQPPNGYKLGKFCGNTSNTTLFATNSNIMTLKFKTNTAVVRRGFKLRYHAFSGTAPTKPPPPALPCGNGSYTIATTLTNHSLISPGYPDGYNGKANCSYSITGPSNTMIHVKVTDSSLSAGPFCDEDYVEVYDGGKLLTVWCSQQRPEFQTTGNQVNLRFIADGSSRYKGFNLTYSATTVPYSCGNQLTATTTTSYLRSPNYPYQYQNNEDCQWNMTTSEKNIKLTIKLMELQGGANCSYDYIAVYDGSSTSAQMLGKICSTATPSFTSSGSNVFIHFHTDGSAAYGGFKMAYIAGNFSVCGETDLVAPFTGFNNLKSPGYPFHYPRNTECVWTIRTSSSSYIVSLTVAESSLEYSSGCFNDYVQVYDGGSTLSSSLGRFCGTQAPRYQSSGRYMTVKFHSNGVNNDKGFRLVYTADLFRSYNSPSSLSIEVGASVGGGAFLIVVAVVVFVYIRRRRRGPTKRRF